MAISSNTIWRVRIGGLDTNGGAFDPSIAGAGTDYTDQDTAQLSLTDLATAGVSASVTSATGGFTSAMIGNAIYIASGTNFTAGTYFVVAVASSNAATLDRNCCTAAASGGVVKLGGAHASISRCSSVGAAAGNTVMVRGQGSNEPVDIDYYTSTYWSGQSSLRYIGYNGRPKISHSGILFYNVSYCSLENFYFIQTSAGYTNQGVLVSSTACLAVNCVFDQGGFDSTQVTYSACINCTFINTGTQVAGTRHAIVLGAGGGYGQSILSCHIKDIRGPGINLIVSRGATVLNTIIQNCGSDGINITTASGVNTLAVSGCTLYGNAGHGITIDGTTHVVKDCLITNHTTSGKYGLYYSVTPAGYGRYIAPLQHSNAFYGNNADCNYALASDDLVANPQFVNAPTDLTPTNTAMRYLAGVGAS